MLTDKSCLFLVVIKLIRSYSFFKVIKVLFKVILLTFYYFVKLVK